MERTQDLATCLVSATELADHLVLIVDHLVSRSHLSFKLLCFLSLQVECIICFLKIVSSRRNEPSNVFVTQLVFVVQDTNLVLHRKTLLDEEAIYLLSRGIKVLKDADSNM